MQNDDLAWRLAPEKGKTAEKEEKKFVRFFIFFSFRFSATAATKNMMLYLFELFVQLLRK